MLEWFQNFIENLKAFFIDKEGSSFSALEKILISISIIIIAWLISKLFNKIMQRGLKVKIKQNVDVSARSFMITLIKWIFWIIISFLVISVLGIDVTSFVGVLSAVTVALGLALQDLIGDFAAGVLILNQKNFLTNDYIKISNSYGTVEGTVKKIGLVTTSLLTFDKQMVYIANSNITNSNVTNYTKEKFRRIVYTVGVNYESDIALAKKLIEDIIKEEPLITNEIKPQVHVSNLGAYSVDVTMKVFTKHEDYWTVYNELSEKVLLSFRKNNINIPSSTDLFIKK